MIRNLNTTKLTTYNNIPAKILVEYCDICARPIQRLYNNSILSGTFPDTMEFSDIMPSHKKHDKCLKENYRPISILSSLSKVFEKNMYDNIYYAVSEKVTPQCIV